MRVPKSSDPTQLGIPQTPRLMRVSTECKISSLRDQTVWVWPEEYCVITTSKKKAAFLPKRNVKPLKAPTEPDLRAIRVTHHRQPKPKPEPKTRLEPSPAGASDPSSMHSPEGVPCSIDYGSMSGGEEHAIEGNAQKNTKQVAAVKTEQPELEKRSTCSRSAEPLRLQTAKIEEADPDSRSRSKCRSRSWRRQAPSCSTSHLAAGVSSESSDVPPAPLKMKLCSFWLENRCLRGDFCTFAHGRWQIGDEIPDLPTGCRSRQLCRRFLAQGRPGASRWGLRDEG